MITVNLSLPAAEVDAICVEARRRRHARETEAYRSTPEGRARHVASTQRWRKSKEGAEKYLKWRDRRRSTIDAMKAKPCKDCGGSFPAVCMDFDHRDGEKKIAGISDLMWMQWDAVASEIAKCDLVCANCHRLRTFHRARGGS